MRVSVLMITYRHEPYVAQAIRSVLEQELEDWELVVGDDASPDGTARVALEHAAADPRIRVLPHDLHMGGQANFLRTLAACRGEYVAQLDGDDYMTSPAKLARQVELLDGDRSLALCVHPVENVFVDSDRAPRRLAPPADKERYTLEDLAERSLFASCSTLLRREPLRDLPRWFDDPPVGDWPLQVLCAHGWGGDVGYLPDVMAARRVHAGGLWSRKSMLQRIETNLAARRLIREHLGPSVEAAARRGDFRDRLHKARELEQLGRIGEARAELAWCRRNLDYRGSISSWRFWRRYLRVAVRSRVPGRAAGRGAEEG